jgi:hypothetical protein
MSNARATHRADRLTARLWELTDKYSAIVYGDLTDFTVTGTDEGIIVVRTSYTDGETLEWFFGPDYNAYAMRDEVKHLVDSKCAEIRKARHEAAEAE